MFFVSFCSPIVLENVVFVLPREAANEITMVNDVCVCYLYIVQSTRLIAATQVQAVEGGND